MNLAGLTANIASRRLSGSFDGQRLFTKLRRSSATGLEQYFERTGGLALIMFNALLFVPFMMAMFFYPIQALIGLGVVLVAAAVLYQGVVLWRRHSERILTYLHLRGES